MSIYIKFVNATVNVTVSDAKVKEDSGELQNQQGSKDERIEADRGLRELADWLNSEQSSQHD